MNELEESKYQNEQEYEDQIRLKVIYEELANMHSRICKEEFRTREESREMLDIVQSVSEPLHVLRHVASTVHLGEQSNSLYIRLKLSKTYEPTSK